jgi:UDP-3-O-[3-hydroxymyristoyl] glucosamine N-acyltransferase
MVGGGGKVFGPVTIGDDVVVGANTMVTYDVPSGSVVGRMPSHIIKRDGRRVSLMQGPTELSRILRDCVSRLEALESAVGITRELAESASTDNEETDC